jgi:hypothetical protein
MNVWRWIVFGVGACLALPWIVAIAWFGLKLKRQGWSWTIALALGSWFIQGVITGTVFMLGALGVLERPLGIIGLVLLVLLWLFGFYIRRRVPASAET